MYKIGDKVILIKELKDNFTIKYTLGESYRIMKKSGNLYYLESDEAVNDWKFWGIWSVSQLKIYFKNLRDERLKKLKQIGESTYRNI